MPITAGIDVGTGAIKVAVFDVEGERKPVSSSASIVCASETR